MFSLLPVTGRYCFSFLVIFKWWFVVLLYWIAFISQVLLLFYPPSLAFMKALYWLSYQYNIVQKKNEHSCIFLLSLWVNKYPTFAGTTKILCWVWWYFETEDACKFACVSFFHSCTYWLVSHSQRMEPLMTVSGSLSEPGSRLSLALSLFLWPVKIETIHIDRKETHWSIQTVSLVSPTKDKLPCIQQELSHKFNKLSIV